MYGKKFCKLFNIIISDLLFNKNTLTTGGKILIWTSIFKIEMCNKTK